VGRADYDLYQRIFFQSPQEIRNGVNAVLLQMDPQTDFSPLNQAVDDCIRLFKGQYPGYRACRTLYHDISHTLSVYLAACRLIHGAHLTGRTMAAEMRIFTLINALFHDAGLIQTADDTEGTGAKYSTGHEVRSIRFTKLYLSANKIFLERLGDSAHIIGSTIVRLPTGEIAYRDEDTRLAGYILGTADLLAQMADRLYLEKLLYLYREFKEAGLSEFHSELDLLKKTEAFYREVSKQRLREELGDVRIWMKEHFAHQMGVRKDFYEESIEKNIVYLRKILLKHEHEYRQMLRRAGIVDNLKNGPE